MLRVLSESVASEQETLADEAVAAGEAQLRATPAVVTISSSVLATQPVASYRQTVLTAFQQVEDELAALRVLQGEIVSQQAAIDAAQRTMEEAAVRYKAGLDPYLNVVQAQMTVLSYRQTMVSLRLQQMLASVQLLEALGGGWQSSDLPVARRPPFACRCLIWAGD